MKKLLVLCAALSFNAMAEPDLYGKSVITEGQQMEHPIITRSWDGNNEYYLKNVEAIVYNSILAFSGSFESVLEPNDHQYGRLECTSVDTVPARLDTDGVELAVECELAGPRPEILFGTAKLQACKQGNRLAMWFDFGKSSFGSPSGDRLNPLGQDVSYRVYRGSWTNTCL